MTQGVDLFFESTLQAYLDNPRYIPRPWLEAECEKKLSQSVIRFLLLEAPAGTGKSAFIAQVASAHPAWPRYFIRRDQRSPLADPGAASFLLRIGFQLAATYPGLFATEQIQLNVEQRIGSASGEIVGAEVGRILASPFHQTIVRIRQQVEGSATGAVGLRVNELITDPRLIPINELQHLALLDPAKALFRQDPKAIIVVLIDALDEVRYHPQIENSIADWISNCPELPSNLRFVVSSRPLAPVTRVFVEKQSHQLQTLTLASTDQRLHIETQQYAVALAAQPEVTRALSATRQTAEEFETRAVRKAGGNIGYLDALARALDQAISKNQADVLRLLLSLESIPGDIEGLYAFVLHQIRDRADRISIAVEDPATGETHYIKAWSAVYRPIISVLAVAAEPVSVDQVRQFGAIKAERTDVLDAIEWLWPFLSAHANGEYSFYHSTLPEFLTADETRDDVNYADMFVEGKRAHGRIAEYYWQYCPNNWNRCDGYGLNNLAFHLEESESYDRLSSLISKEWMSARSTGAFSGFLQDVDLAWKAHQSRSKDLGELVRLQTARQMVEYRITAYSEVDLQTMVWLDRDDEALANARLILDPNTRFMHLVVIAGTVSERDQEKWEPSLSSEIIDVARSIDDAAKRAIALAICSAPPIVVKPSERRSLETEAIRIAESIVNAETRATCTQKLAQMVFADCPDLSRKWLREAVATVQTIEDPETLNYQLRDVALDLLHAGCIDEAEELIAEIEKEFTKDRVRISLVSGLIRTSQLDRALSVAKVIGTPAHRIDAFRQLGSALTNSARYDEALTIAREHRDPVLLGELAEALSSTDLTRSDALFDEAEHALSPNTDAEQRAQFMGSLLRSDRFDSALRVATNCESDSSKARALIDLAALMRADRPKDAVQLLEQARTIILGIEVEFSKNLSLLCAAEAYARIGLSDQAESLAAGITDVQRQTEALVRISKVMIDGGTGDRALAIMRTIQDLEKRSDLISAYACKLAQSGDPLATTLLNEVLELKQWTNDAQEYRETLYLMAEALDRNGQPGAAKLWSIAESAIDPNNESTWFDLASALARCGHMDQCFDAMEKISRTDLKRSICEEVILRLAERNDLDRAIQMIRSLSTDDQLSTIRLLLAVAQIALKAGNSQGESVLMDAAVAISKISNDQTRMELLREIATVVNKFGTPSMVSKMTELLNANVDSFARSVLAAALANMGEFELSFDMANDITDANVLAHCQQGISTALISAGRLSEARILADTIAEPAPKAIALAEVAASMAADAHADTEALLSEAYSAWKNLEDPAAREYAGHTIACHYGEKGLIGEAQQIVDLMLAEGYRPLTAGMIAAATPVTHPLRQGLLDKAYQWAMSTEESLGGSFLVHHASTAMAQAGDPRAREVLHHVLEVDRELGIAPRDTGDAFGLYWKEVKGLMWSYHNNGHIEEAIETAQLVPEAMFELIKGLLAKGELDEADRLSESITRSDERAEIRSLRADAMMYKGRAIDAIVSLGSLALESYLQRIARWTADQELHVPVAAIENALSVAGWSHPYWRGIHGAVFQPTSQ